MSKSYKSDALAAVYETASDLHDAGLMDKRTLREYDELCLTPVPDLSPDEIKAIRMQAHVSQSVFALYLNFSRGVVSKWERGEKHPAGPSLKLLDIIRKNGLEALA
jgi:putative transcriptional regulator